MATSGLDEPPPPPPPPKHDDSPRNQHTARPIVSSQLGLDIPLSPVSPSSLPSPVDKTPKYSPLTDLIESEKAYVELLTGIIRKVAAAWSRSNLPPPELDVMFRSVEAVYKTNRTLLAKLKEIGENPSSPKALGDLLMRWIDELEQPYMTYADRYCTGFDDWELVKSNSKLPAVLEAFSASNPHPLALPQPTRSLNPSLWTLDTLFLLPKGRLQYYRKLYSRLLKSTTPGRSDHRLLTGALGKLDALLATLDDRANNGVSNPGPSQIPPPPRVNIEMDPATVISMQPSTNEPMESGVLLSGQFGADSASAATSLRGSFSSRDERLSQETASTSVSLESSRAVSVSSPVLDLERRLATESTLDIFTMQPKQIRLQIVPPALPYTRELRLSVKVLVRFTPKATGVEVVHRRGNVYILSDLFLLCEEMSRDERAARCDDGQDMRLCYPPLSGKVLNVTEVPGQDNSLQVFIMRQETLVLEADSQLKRDRILNELQECISFAKTISRAAQEPVPPLPPLDNPPQSPTTRLKTSGSPSRERPDRALNPRLLPQSQPGNIQSKWNDDATSITDRTPVASSPRQNNGLLVMPLSQTRPEQQNVVLTQLEMTQPRVVGSPPSSPASPGNGQRIPTLHHPGSIYPPRGSSAGYTTNSPPSAYVPGQIIPPGRSAIIQSHSPPFAMAASDLPGGQGGVYPPPIAQNPPPQNSTLRHHASMHSLRQQPLQHQPSLHSLPHRLNHQNVAPAPHPQLGPHSPNGQSFFTHPSSPPVMSHPVEQSSHKLQKSLSSRSLHGQYQHSEYPLPPLPSLPGGLPPPQRPYSQRKNSVGSLNISMSKPLLPSMQMGSSSVAEPSILDPSPPTSPAEERKSLGPVRSVIVAQMKCKVFHQQHHAQWKSLGSANLTLYRQEPTNVKQLVVAGNKEKSTLISTIVLTDGVERVGKTGVAIELSDAGGARTGIIYMIQLRNEETASGLFKTLLAGSDRAA